MPVEFDPLVEFHGVWNTTLAERHLPIPGVRAGRYECLGGYLVTGPPVRPADSYGAVRLAVLLDGAARRAGHHLYGTLEVTFGDDTWLQPDLTVLRRLADDSPWVPAAAVLMPVEFVSPGSRRRAHIDRTRVCADAGVPWYLRVEIDRPAASAYVRLDRLVEGDYVEHAVAHDGQRFRISEPFVLDFDPAQLLER